MNRSRLVASLAAALGLACLLVVQTVVAKEPLEGTWVLNREKSTFSLPPPPKGQMRRYAISGDLERMTAHGISADGNPTKVTYTARYDGKDYAIKGSAGGDQITLRRIDPLTTESTEKQDGKVTVTAVRHVSEDGKTLTVETRGTLPDGRALHATLVFERR